MTSHATTDSDLPAYITDEGRRDYFAQVPNLLDDLELDVFASRLYLHIKRRAGENGYCNEGLRGMAATCKMSLSSAAKARQELLDLGLISSRVEVISGSGKERTGRFEFLTVVDVWAINNDFYDRVKRKELKPSAARAFLINYLVSNGRRVVKQREKSRRGEEPKPPVYWSVEESRAHLTRAGYLSDEGVLPQKHPAGGVMPGGRGCAATKTGGVLPGELKKTPFGRRPEEENSPPARSRATSAPPESSVEGEGASRSLSFEDFVACVEAESKTPAGAGIASIRAVASSRWNKGNPSPYDVRQVRTFLAGARLGSVEAEMVAPPAQVECRNLEPLKRRITSTLDASNAASPAAVVDEVCSTENLGADDRQRLLDWVATVKSGLVAQARARSTPDAPASSSTAPGESLRLVQPAAGAR